MLARSPLLLVALDASVFWAGLLRTHARAAVAGPITLLRSCRAHIHVEDECLSSCGQRPIWVEHQHGHANLGGIVSSPGPFQRGGN